MEEGNIKIEDLIFDDKNFNKGTEYGKHLMQKSLGKFGAGRSILIDKNGKIIAGNKTAENFGELGLDNVKVIKTDGNTLIAVQRSDIDLDTPEGREFALADNQTAKTNIDFDFELINDELGEVIEDWGVGFISDSELDYSILEDEDIDHSIKDMNDGVKKAIQIEFELSDYEQAQDLVKYWRGRDAYIGSMIIEKLKDEKLKVK